MAPRTRYTKVGGINIAYQVVGDGPIDLVFAQGWATHLELAWEIPAMARPKGPLYEPTMETG